MINGMDKTEGMTYVILRSGCHECGEPVDLVGAFAELDQARAAAVERLQPDQPWFEVSLEVWRVVPGEVEQVLDVSRNEWIDGGIQVAETTIEEETT